MIELSSIIQVGLILSQHLAHYVRLIESDILSQLSLSKAQAQSEAHTHNALNGRSLHGLAHLLHMVCAVVPEQSIHKVRQAQHGSLCPRCCGPAALWALMFLLCLHA